ncbi:MAG: hypothetical protein PHW96_02905 [Candidatus Nanoarchaeia archaeon]|nr:hypothetical protein [Candidatus Nanoarchaeia archaeon]
MVRVAKTIGQYELHFELGEVDTVEKISALIECGKIGMPGLLINAIIAVQHGKGIIKTEKQADAFEEKLMKEFKQLRNAYYEEFKLMERDDVDWKEVMQDLLVIALEDLFSKYL